MRVWVAGHAGFAGKAITSYLRALRHDVLTVSSSDLDLRRGEPVSYWLNWNRPEAIVLVAARAGGVLSNATYPADYISENLLIQTNVIAAAHACDVDHLIFLGTSCIYPRLAEQPMRETGLMAGPLEPTTEAYAIAKIAGLKMCQAYNRQHGRRYVTLLPCNLYGPHDNFDVETGHVVAGLINRIHSAHVKKSDQVELWGTGTPFRELMHVDDLARAVGIVLSGSSYDVMNCGSGTEISTLALAQVLCRLIGFQGKVAVNVEKPDGVPRKCMDSSRLRALGWEPMVELETGLRSTYEWYREWGAK